MSKNPSRGRSKKGVEKIVVGYKIDATFERDEEELAKYLNKKGGFILATNELDKEKYKNEQILEEYKEQQKMEGGFRFLKDPSFMLDSIFLRLPSRAEALLIIMALCLLVCNVGQYRLRGSLKVQKTSPKEVAKLALK